MEKENLFKNRLDASNFLITVLPIENMKLENWIVIATSTGALPIAKSISDKINAKIDFMFTQKIMAPYNAECEIAIVTEKEEVVIHEELVRSFDINLESIFTKAKERFEKNLILEIKKYRESSLSDLNGQNVLLVDEGLNTGLTMMACIKTAIKMGAKSVSVATPIMPTATVGDIESIADDLYFYKSVDHFISIDFYYEELEVIKMEEIKKYIKGK